MLLHERFNILHEKILLDLPGFPLEIRESILLKSRTSGKAVYQSGIRNQQAGANPGIEGDEQAEDKKPGTDFICKKQTAQKNQPPDDCPSNHGTPDILVEGQFL